MDILSNSKRAYGRLAEEKTREAVSPTIGKILGEQAFGPYGEQMTGTFNGKTLPSGYRPITGYTGHINEDLTGLIYMRGRYYSPKWHRFINSDQGVDPNSINQFAYVNGSPFMAIDPSGMDKEDILSTTVYVICDDCSIMLDYYIKMQNLWGWLTGDGLKAINPGPRSGGGGGGYGSGSGQNAQQNTNQNNDCGDGTLAVAGATNSALEFVSGNTTIGSNGKIYWHPMSNGFLGGTRARIKVATPAKVFRGVGVGMIGVGAAMDFHSAFILQDGDPNKISGGKFFLNSVIGAASLINPVTATIGATYGLIDYQWNGDWGQFFRDSADGWSSILGRNPAKQPCDNKGSKK